MLERQCDNALNVVSAFDVDNGLALYQQAAKNKGQEGQVVRDIIDILACKDCIVTLDALHCQTKTLETIVKNKATLLSKSKPISVIYIMLSLSTLKLTMTAWAHTKKHKAMEMLMAEVKVV
ncbi:ISAs1 family transposase [Pseudoalteromonas sp. DL-6]|uniref:ISAs1 family transposase n=1 Tax=Pseudoalteromonas sp. DL-6 TaxID=1390185 RepID=UPI00103897F4|nr:ISAs1 family transposase [Pseudoalteromonas sp. DL-6]